MIVFFKANSDSCGKLVDILQDFGWVSGLLINYQKFELIFSQNTPKLMKKFLSFTFGVNVVSKLGKYLGIFIDFKLSCKENFQDIMAKLNRKLPG